MAQQVNLRNHDAWAKVQLARMPERPKPQHLLPLLFDGLIEWHGDRFAGDDATIFAGIGEFDGKPVTVIATRRGNDLQSNLAYRFGMPQPEGYRKALRHMRMAEKFGRPVILFIDTPGAYPGLESEERGISSAIAYNLLEMSGLKTPMISVITGEGGSGGALALMVTDRVLMLENAVLSVISPEGCASILFKDAQKAPDAARCLGIDSSTLESLRIVDRIVPEGAGMHIEREATVQRLRVALREELAALAVHSETDLLETRYAKLRRIGVFYEDMEQV